MEDVAKISAVQAAFNDKTVLTADKKTLERYLLAIATNNVLAAENRSRFEEMGGTIRLLLTVKASRETQSRATLIAVIALVISLAAFLCSFVQAYYAHASFQLQYSQSLSSSKLPISGTPTPER